MLNGNEIKRRREALGLSQGELAKKCGLSQQSMSRIENNLSRESSSVGRLSSALNCSVHDIDPDFTGAEPAYHSLPAVLSDEAGDLLSRIATRMEGTLGFRPTDTQVIRHLMAKSAYSDLLE